jgi:RNA polymerase sigma-70 factor (ECF subfamily)
MMEMSHTDVSADDPCGTGADAGPWGAEESDWDPIPAHRAHSGQGFSAEERDEFVGRLYAEEGAAVLYFVTRLSAGDRHRAEDIVQETMLRAWQHAPALARSGRSPRPWLFTVARRLVIDAKRLRDTRPQEIGEEMAASVPSAEAGIDTVIARDEVVAALSTLAPIQREVLVHVHYFGRSVAETAELLGVPQGTVKSRMFYAVKLLRTTLAALEAA